MNAKGSCKYLASLDKQRKYQNNPLVKQYRNLYIGFSNSYNYRKGSTNSDNLWLDIQTAYHKKCCQFRSSIHESNSIKEQYAEYLKTVKKLKKQFPDVSDFYAKFSEYNDSIKL